MKKVIRLLVVLIVAAGAVGVIYAYVGSRDTDSNGFKLVGAEIGSITEKALAVGQIQPRERFQVKSKISGIVGRCFVEVGDEVRAGDPLFEIAPDPTPQELLFVDHGLRSAQASFQKAEADYRRGLELHEDGLTSKGDLDALEELHELAQVALEQARDNRELTRSGKVTGGVTEVETVIRSMASGTVLSRAVNPSDPVVPLTSYQPGTELATIADMGDLIFKGTVDEIDVGKISAGMPCRIKVGALPGEPVTGRLARIAPQAKKEAGATLFDVEIELDPDQDVYLRAGYSANAEVVIRGIDDIVIIPERLVIFEDHPRTAGHLRGGHQRDLCRGPGDGPRGRARQGGGQIGTLGRHQRRDRRGSQRRRSGHPKAATRSHLVDLLTMNYGLRISDYGLTPALPDDTRERWEVGGIRSLANSMAAQTKTKMNMKTKIWWTGGGIRNLQSAIRNDGWVGEPTTGWVAVNPQSSIRNPQSGGWAA